MGERRSKEAESGKATSTLVCAVHDYGPDALDYVAEDSREETLLPTGSMVNGRYRVLNLLGRGGMGVVYQVADNLHPNRQVALKIVWHQILR